MRVNRATAVVGILMAAMLSAVPAAGAVTTKTISMTSSRTFSPAAATVTRGTVVKWRNNSLLTHTTTSNSGLWNRRVAPGQSFSFTFRNTGTYRYRCTLHAGMTGKIVVK